MSKEVQDTIEDFLFKKIEDDLEYQHFREYDIPAYVTDNLAKTLRPYQEEAIKRMMYQFEKGNAKHLLFNMATGSGKTLVMAANMLYLYDKGYRNFVFLVHNKNILTQAIDNFTNPNFEKYLFAQKVSFNGRVVSIKQVRDFEDGADNDLKIQFLTTQLLFRRLVEVGENRIMKRDFEDNKTVIIADEAHRLNVMTRNTDAAVKEERNWEKEVADALSANEESLLMEFTATVDLQHRKIHEKYKGKLVYKYDFLHFNKDGYSKNVRFLYNHETQIENQKRLLIVNAVALSQYRKERFRILGFGNINPIVLLKSSAIAKSGEDRDFFCTVIETLSEKDFRFLKKAQKDENRILAGMMDYLGNREGGINSFIQDIRAAFAEQHTIVYNSKEKNAETLLKDLDTQNPRNAIRAVFSVNALNEGWDVRSLFDIIHFDIGSGKGVSMQDIQLIGRGARYCPFVLREDLARDNLFSTFTNEEDQRKFDKADVNHELRVLETFYYHFVEKGTFLDGLMKALKGEGILDEEVATVSIRMKEGFLSSDTYKNGFVLVNKIENRSSTTEDEKKDAFDRVLEIKPFELFGEVLGDTERNQKVAAMDVDTFKITDMGRGIIKKALFQAENGFFRFNTLKNHLPGIHSMDAFIDDALSRYTISYTYERTKPLESLEYGEKLQLLVGEILPEVRKILSTKLPKRTGSTVFRPVSIRQVFSKEKSVHVVAYGNEPIDERGKPQTDNPNSGLALTISELEWYAYDENYGTSEEKKFVKFIHSQVEELFEKYKNAEIFLIRNELDYWIYGTKNGKRFSPDYLLLINDWQNKSFYYQCIFEVKGAHLLDKDAWKEDVLQELSDTTKISFESAEDDVSAYRKYLSKIKECGYENIKNIGFAFYCSENKKQDLKFKNEFERVKRGL